METLREIINEHKSIGKQIFVLAKSDLIRTYKGAALGWAWAVVKPMITLFVWWFGMTVGLRGGKPVNGYPYFLWQMAGFIPWFYMKTMIPGGAGCIRRYRQLVTKMKFPVSVIPTFCNIAELMVHLVLLGLGLIVFFIYGERPDIYLLQIPLYMLMMFVSFTLWSLFAGMLGAISKDFLNFVKSLSTAIFWFSGIIYDVNTIHNFWIRNLLKLNPVTVIAYGYRRTFIYKQWFFEDKVEMVCYLISLVTTFFLALWAYKKLRKEIPDVL